MEQKRSYRIIALAAGLVILAGAVLLVMLLFASTNDEPEAILGDDGVTIVGQYGETILYTDIAGISLKDSIPAIGYKSDGAGLGEIKKGKWQVEGMGKCRLFVMSESGPFVVMDTKSGYVIINYKDAEKTRAVYEDLKKLLE